jgi:hypothetical protein
MASTCRAGDACAPQEIREAWKKVIAKKPGHRSYLDDEASCLLGETGGPTCGQNDCRWASDGRKKPNHTPSDRIP